MGFKNITAKFSVVEDTAFKQGKWKEDRSNFIFEVRRYESGATGYGDKSAHSLEIVNVPCQNYYYDTRYEGISTKKDMWVDYWQDYIQDKWQLKIKLDTYAEEDV